MTLHDMTLHSIALCCIALHCIPSHYISCITYVPLQSLHTLDQIGLDWIRLGQIRLDQVRLGQIRLDQIKSDQIKSDQIKSDQIRLQHITFTFTLHYFYLCIAFRLHVHYIYLAFTLAPKFALHYIYKDNWQFGVLPVKVQDRILYRANYLYQSPILLTVINPVQASTSIKAKSFSQGTK